MTAIRRPADAEAPPPPLHRVLVVGTSCVGKSTFAARLAVAIDGPHVELDALHWGPHWTPKPGPEFNRLVAEATQGPRWVTDGNYSPVRQTLWPRATTVVWLNYGLPRTVWRGLRRTLRRCWTREELWGGNRESLRLALLSRDSLLLWILTTHAARRREFRALRASDEYHQLTWIEFTTPRQAEAWLRSIEARAANERQSTGTRPNVPPIEPAPEAQE